MLGLLCRGKMSDLHRLVRRHGLAASILMALESYDRAEGRHRDILKALIRRLYLWLENEGDYSARQWYGELAARRREFIRRGFWQRVVATIQAMPYPLREATVYVAVPAALVIMMALAMAAVFFPVVGKWTDSWIDALR